MAESRFEIAVCTLMEAVARALDRAGGATAPADVKTASSVVPLKPAAPAAPGKTKTTPAAPAAPAGNGAAAPAADILRKAAKDAVMKLGAVKGREVAVALLGSIREGALNVTALQDGDLAGFIAAAAEALAS